MLARNQKAFIINGYFIREINDEERQILELGADAMLEALRKKGYKFNGSTYQEWMGEDFDIIFKAWKYLKGSVTFIPEEENGH